MGRAKSKKKSTGTLAAKPRKIRPKFVPATPKTTGSAIKLYMYLVDHDMSYGSFGEQVGVSRQCVWAWCFGVNRPSLQYATAVEKATHGKVRAVEWH